MMRWPSKNELRDARRKERDKQDERERQAEAVRRKYHPTVEERLEDVEAVLREHFGVILNGY